jgi:hypothetical protein
MIIPLLAILQTVVAKDDDYSAGNYNNVPTGGLYSYVVAAAIGIPIFGCVIGARFLIGDYFSYEKKPRPRANFRRASDHTFYDKI